MAAHHIESVKVSSWLIAVLFSFNCGVAFPAWGQMDMSGHAMETQDETPPAKLPVPQKMTGIGNAHMQITATPETQMWFNQGLNLLHDFWDYEAARAFEQGVRVDPKCAMCYWGLYKAESFYHSTAQGYAGQALAKAVSLENYVSKRERLYIEASAAEENAAKNQGPRPSPSQALMLARELVRKYPEDPQARIFLAGFVDHEESLALLQSVLKDNPQDSAANHYYIHALEGSEHPEQALHSAEILATLAPASGHMVHMPGHIFFRIGDYARAEQAFAASMQVDERYMQEQHVSPDNDWNYVHNLMYAIADLMEEGKLKQATALSVKLTAARGKLESTLYIYSTRDSITRLDPRLPVALRTGDWAQVIGLLEASAPPAARPNLAFLARQLAGFAAGMQAIETHDLPRAEESSSRLDAELWRMSPQSKASPGMQRPESKAFSGEAPKLQVRPDALLQPLVTSLSIMSLELRASLLTAQRKTAEAKSLFANAAQQEKALGYREPPNYIRPVGETEGAAMIAIGDWTDAKSAYEQALLERPRSGFALYGVALSSEKSGNTEAARKKYADFLAAWKDADQTLAQVRHAQAYLAEHASAADFAQTPRATNLAVQQLNRWLAAYDDNNWDVYREFLKTKFAAEAENMFQDRSIRNQTGRFDLVRIEEETPTKVIALLNGRDSDKVGRIVVEVEAAEPHRILKLQARVIDRPPELALPHLNERELIGSLQSRLEEAVSADKFSGAVLVAKNGKPIFAQAYGLADREHHIPNSLKTRFRIGSMNKMFTAVAVLQLVSAGKLEVDAPLGKYLSGYPNKELASKVTISQLLSHTGGTGDFFGPEFDRHRQELRTHQDYVRLFGSRPIRFEPGSRFEYSNYGFLILGAVIGEVSGQSYYDYVRDHVYSPAGMTSTGSEPEDQPVPDRSIGYTKEGGSAWHPNTNFLPYRGTSAGGGYTTVGDLLSFANALREDRLLDAHSTKLLTTGRVDMPFGGRYPYGFEDRTINGSSCFGHDGGSPGMNGDLELCQDSAYIVIALANMDPEAAKHMSDFVVNRLPASKTAP